MIGQRVGFGRAMAGSSFASRAASLPQSAYAPNGKFLRWGQQAPYSRNPPRFLPRLKFPMAKFFVNGEQVDFRAAPDTPLLWALRDQLGLTGTKFGCGMAQCGACTVHLDGQPIRSCVTPVSAIEGKRVVTIEGLGHTAQGQGATA